MSGLGVVDELLGQFRILGPGFVVEGVAGKEVDQVEELAPLTRAPEPPEIDAPKGQVRLDRVAVATN